MKHTLLVALSAVLLAGCVPGGDPLLPELQGRWAPERGAEVRVALASTNSSLPAKAPNIKELCQSEFVTFQKSQTVPGFFGTVFLYRDSRRGLLFVVKEAKREGERIILAGQEPFQAMLGEGQARIELILRNGAITFDNVFDQRGRSIRYDRFKVDDAVRAYRANITTVGDVFRLLFDLKSCTA